MGTCASANTNDKDANEITKRNIDINSNLEKKGTTEVLKLLDGHYNIIFGPDPNSALVIVEGFKLLKIGDAPNISYELNDNGSSIAEYGQVR